LSLVSWAQAPLADTIIATVTMAHPYLESACMIILSAGAAHRGSGGSAPQKI
jgi:hypothetical protein